MTSSGGPIKDASPAHSARHTSSNHASLQTMLQFMRVNTGFSITLALLTAGLLICSGFAWLMHRSGASMRPIAWFAGFFALIVVPQVLGHLYKALQGPLPESAEVAPGRAIESTKSSTSETREMEPRSLFGPDIDTNLISDVRGAYGNVFAHANQALFAVMPQGESVIMARFDTTSAAEEAWAAYLRVTGLQAHGTGDSQRGFAVTRPIGDRLYARPCGALLGIWTGTDDATIRARMQVGGFDVPSLAPLNTRLSEDVQASGGRRPEPRSGKAFGRIALTAAGLTVYLFLLVLYYFKGAGWAGTYRARREADCLSASALASRLEGINQLNVPFHIERGAQPNELIATWRYADARWIDFAGVRGMKRTHRVRMVLDDRAHTVRATDYVSLLGASAGSGGATFQWRSGMGIVLFQQEHQEVLGVQFDDAGRIKPDLSYSYHFNLQELKTPLIEAVIRSGWNWRPTLWEGPSWLRWLTE